MSFSYFQGAVVDCLCRAFGPAVDAGYARWEMLFTEASPFHRSNFVDSDLGFIERSRLIRAALFPDGSWTDSLFAVFRAVQPALLAIITCPPRGSEED